MPVGPQNLMVDPKAVVADLCANVRNVRERLGLTQEDLAYASGVSVRQVAAIERGTTNPTVETLAALAAGLKVSPASLLTSEVPIVPTRHRG